MPLYEYQCESCQRRFEKIQKYSDPPPDVCPQCGKGPIRKLVSSPAIQFKGSGWYITDYARKSAGDGGKASDSTTPPPSSSSSSTGDTSASTSKPADSAAKKD